MKALLFAQRDFSGGQVNAGMQRRDDGDAARTGARTQRNWRIEQAGQLVPRPGRRPISLSIGLRADPVRMATGFDYLIGFGAGQISIANTSGTVLVTRKSADYIWTADTIWLVQWVKAGNQIVITFGGMRPQVVPWDPDTQTWGVPAQFNFQSGGGQVFEPFYNFRQDGSTMAYTGTVGAGITLTCSVPFFSASYIGASLSIAGQQVVITGVANSTHATATVGFRLPDAISVPVVDTTPFQVGQVVSATIQPIKFEVTSIGSGTVNGVLISAIKFNGAWVWKPDGSVADILVGPYGSSAFTANPVQGSTSDQITSEWQEEFMSAARGWPGSCFYDHSRLGFCDFPQKPEAVLWSTIDVPNSLWVDQVAAALNPQAGTLADSAMLEFIASTSQGPPGVHHVVGWGDEFVFTDRGIFQIPISSSGNPLKPGSVEFRMISNDGVSNIRPIPSQDVIVYMNFGRNRMCVVRATGAYSRPYVTQDMSDNHSDLFDSPTTFTLVAGDGQIPERYVYVVNSDKTMVVGKFTPDRTFVGWSIWDTRADPATGQGISWASSIEETVYFTSLYQNTFVEVEDTSLFMDQCLFINNLPAALAPPAGKGPLWLFTNQTVTLMDGALDMGDRQVDGNGFIIAQNGEDLLHTPTLVAGIFAPPVFEPIVPGAQPGDDLGQRQKRRKIKRAMVNVQNFSGFTFGNRTFPVTYFGDDATKPPVVRGDQFSIRPLGRSYDPSVTITKDRPGPMRICELSLEVTI